MNDRHPSAGPGPTVPAPDTAYGQTPYGQSHGQYASYEQQTTAYAPAGYDGSGQWDTTSGWGSGQTQVWDFSALDSGRHTGQWPAAGDSGQWQWNSPASPDSSGQWTSSGHWDTGGHGQQMFQDWQATGYSGHPQDSGQWESTGWGHRPDDAWANGTTGQTQTWDTSAYATVDEPAAAPQHDPTLVSVPADPRPDPAEWSPAPSAAPSVIPSVADCDTRTMAAVVIPPEMTGEETAREAAPEAAAPSGQPPHVRSRRKGAQVKADYRPRRKALLTVAVPSVAVMGVAGIAAASVASTGGPDAKQTQASAADTSVKFSAANSKLDTQLAGLSRGADDFATRASRTQERLDLKARQEQERKRKAEEAARKEAERPKFALPVTQHGLSALFGQAGVNWMSVHTGIDFPVSYGTPVMAATDGTVRTQYNVAYGNMAIVTAPDGTETWYCHLSSTRMRSGQVKAGDVIAYSGNSGNSTGPHLHFEVRPNGSAVDPLPWLRGHGLDPT
ncbi:peptidoglycan DD-metalloendopeptidase family protein [Streptomyces sp. NPDC052396]|uniref:peptidoglycan DD-metalloendopeptidase family protein n=1 Tax=Streptomyces sp. NPDC052396 TaxID=3365689 RepID=UPI0037D30E86